MKAISRVRECFRGLFNPRFMIARHVESSDNVVLAQNNFAPDSLPHKNREPFGNSVTTLVLVLVLDSM